MIRKLEPIVGEWYRDHGEQRLFEVVAMDDADDRINIQYADGDLLQIDRDSWKNLLLSMAPPPEDSLAAGAGLGDDDNSDEDALPNDDWHDDHDSIDLDDY